MYNEHVNIQKNYIQNIDAEIKKKLNISETYDIPFLYGLMNDDITITNFINIYNGVPAQMKKLYQMMHIANSELLEKPVNSFKYPINIIPSSITIDLDRNMSLDNYLLKLFPAEQLTPLDRSAPLPPLSLLSLSSPLPPSKSQNQQNNYVISDSDDGVHNLDDDVIYDYDIINMPTRFFRN
jgi:hypothetical protein